MGVLPNKVKLRSILWIIRGYLIGIARVEVPSGLPGGWLTRTNNKEVLSVFDRGCTKER